MMITAARLVPLVVVFHAGLPTLPAQAQTDTASAPDWVQESNDHARVLLEVMARFAPEEAGRFGADGLDEDVRDLLPGFNERHVDALQQAHAELEARLAQAEDGPVRLDIQLLLQNAEDEIAGIRLDETHLLPYIDVARIIYDGIRSLLEDRIPAERHSAALIRLSRYAGRAEGYPPFAESAERYLRSEWDAPEERLPPYRGEIERGIGTSERFIDEIGSLFEQYGLEGYEADYRALRQQVEGFYGFVREEILPRARTDFRLPEAVYSFRLRQHGVDMPVDEVRRRAAVAYKELQNQMQALALHIAERRGLDTRDYRDVIRVLKSEQFDGEEILSAYRQRVGEIEAIIERERIVTLPERDMRIRLATEAESAAQPSAFMSPPRLIGNTGEYAEFVIPQRLPGDAGGGAMPIDDFTYDAASWPLAAHEGRPGHELHVASLIERGVSLARTPTIFALNSTNIEGWGLYAEFEMYPYLPLEGQFATLWSLAVRAARAFLDTGLHSGLITRDDAWRLLREDLVISETLARAELDRYLYRAPGQATAYFVGYSRLMELRADTELLLGGDFDRRAFHDFILSQGVLPPALLRQAVLESFVPANRRGTG